MEDDPAPSAAPEARAVPVSRPPRIGGRKALTGILFVPKSGIPWEMLPKEMGCGPGMTCWRRLKEWHEAGVWQSLHELLLSKLQGAAFAPRQAGDRQAGRRARQRAGRVALGGGANPGMAASVPQTASGYEQRDDVHEAFLSIGCSLICFRLLSSFC